MEVFDLHSFSLSVAHFLDVDVDVDVDVVFDVVVWCVSSDEVGWRGRELSMPSMADFCTLW